MAEMLTRVNYVLFLNQSQKNKELFLQTPKTGGYASQGGIIQRELIGNHGLSRSSKRSLAIEKLGFAFFIGIRYAYSALSYLPCSVVFNAKAYNYASLCLGPTASSRDLMLTKLIASGPTRVKSPENSL